MKGEGEKMKEERINVAVHAHYGDRDAPIFSEDFDFYVHLLSSAVV